jgi:hypothetical protein
METRADNSPRRIERVMNRPETAISSPFASEISPLSNGSERGVDHADRCHVSGISKKGLARDLRSHNCGLQPRPRSMRLRFVCCALTPILSFSAWSRGRFSVAFESRLQTARPPLPPLAKGGEFFWDLYSSAQDLERNYKNWKEFVEFRAAGGVFGKVQFTNCDLEGIMELGS